MSTAYSYDNANRLTRLSHTTGGGSVTLGDYQFAVDAVGNRTAITETVQVPGMGGARRVFTSTQILLPFVGNQAPGALPTVQSTQYPILLPFLSNGGVSPAEQRRVEPLDPAGRVPVRAPTAALPTPNKTAVPKTAAPKTAAPGQTAVPTRALVPAQTATPTDQRRVGEVADPREAVRGGVLPRVAESVTETTTISYSYDPLYRVTGATYAGGLTNSYGYAYDAVGNRTVQTQTITSTLVTNYGYDNANRLTSVNGQPYTWDDNGNLLDDGAQTYGYDQANRLKQVVQGAITTTFAYNGAGDRLQQTVNGSPTRYVLDPAAGLTQVLSDGTNTYLYGNGRLAQYQTAMQYFGADALGSVRQIYDTSGAVIGSSRYDPYGSLMSHSGTASSAYGFTGEWADATGLTYLRARYYSAAQGRFTTRDVWEGDPNAPMSYNAWLYAYGNPANLMDPTGQFPWPWCWFVKPGTWGCDDVPPTEPPLPPGTPRLPPTATLTCTPTLPPTGTPTVPPTATPYHPAYSPGELDIAARIVSKEVGIGEYFRGSDAVVQEASTAVVWTMRNWIEVGETLYNTPGNPQSTPYPNKSKKTSYQETFNKYTPYPNNMPAQSDPLVYQAVQTVFDAPNRSGDTVNSAIFILNLARWQSKSGAGTLRVNPVRVIRWIPLTGGSEQGIAFFRDQP